MSGRNHKTGGIFAMENRDPDRWDSDKQSPDSDSDVSFGKNTGRSGSFDEESSRGSGSESIEGGRKSDEDVEKYEDTTPMSNRGGLSEH
jgi:hypothetical protein